MIVTYDLEKLSVSEITDLINSLSIELKIRKEQARKEQAEKCNMITVMEFAEKFPVSVRLGNVLRARFKDELPFYLHELTKNQFFLLRNAGVKCWEEYKDIINNSEEMNNYPLLKSIMQRYLAEQEE